MRKTSALDLAARRAVLGALVCFRSGVALAALVSRERWREPMVPGFTPAVIRRTLDALARDGLVRINTEGAEVRVVATEDGMRSLDRGAA